MSYDLYRQWVKAMDDHDLNRELEKTLAASRRGSMRARAAWGRMHETCVQVQRLRDGKVLSI